MPTTPRLPAALVGILGVLATLLTAVQDVLPSPWAEVAAAAVAILTAIGVPATLAVQRRHAQAIVRAVQRPDGTHDVTSLGGGR